MKNKRSRYFFKRILSLLLITAMLAGNLPMTGRSVYAMEEEGQQLLSEIISDNEGEAVSDNGEVAVSDDEGETVSDNEGETVSDNEGETVSNNGDENRDPQEERFTVYPEGDILSVQSDSEQATQEEKILSTDQYQGTIFEMQNGGKGLSVLESDVLSAGLSFDDETILSLLKQQEEKKEKFEAIELIYENKNPDKITKELWNQMAGMLEGEEQVIFLGGKDPEKKVNLQWIFIQPTATEQDLNLKATAVCGTEGEGISFRLENTDFAAARADFLLMAHSTDAEGYENFTKALGEKSCAQITDSNGQLSLYLEAEIERWEREGENYCRIRVCNIQNTPAGESFTVKSTPYRGQIWVDEYSRRSNLELLPQMVGKEAFTLEELTELMSYYTSERFDEIYLEYPITDHQLKKDEINLLSGYLKENQENGEKFVKIGFYEQNRETGETMAVEEWRIVNPNRRAALTANQPVSFTVTSENNVIKAQLLKPEVAAERVEAWYLQPKDSAQAEKLRDTFGEHNFALHFLNNEGQAVGEGRFQTTDDPYKDVIELYDISGITSGESVTLQKKYGWEFTENWGQGDRNHLSFSSMDIGKNTFDRGDLEKYLNYYVKTGKKFDSIYIEQRNVSGKNMIKKDDINFLRSILAEANGDHRTEIVYTFCSCLDEEEKGHITNDINWILSNPGEAAADLDADISFVKAAGIGLKVKFNKAPYQGEELAVQIRSNENTSMAGDMQEALGEAPDSPEHEPVIIVLEKSTILHPNFQRNYWKEKEGEGEAAPTVTCLHFGNLKDYTAGTEYLLAPLHIRGGEDKYQERFFLGAAEHNQKLLQEELKDITSKITWQSYTPETLMITKGVAEAVNQGEAYYSASYTIGKTNYLKVFRNQVEVELQDWMPETRQIELELYRDGEDIRGQSKYLQIFFYPTFANMDQRELTWEIIQGQEVIELVKERVEYYDEQGQMTIAEKESGEIRAKAAGEATIKITLPDYIPFEKQNKEGYSEDGRSVICTVKVWNPLEIPEEDWPQECIAVTNFDTALKNVAIPQRDGARGTFEWLEPETSLSDYFDLRGHSFPAIYTPNDGSGRKIETSLYVRFVSIRGIGIGLYRQMTVEGENQEDFIFQPGDKGMMDGDEIVLGYLYKVFNGNNQYLQKYKDRLEVSWSTKPAGIGTIEQVGDQLRFKYTAKKQEAGIKQITVTLTNKDTGKVIGKDTIKLTVMKETVAGLWNLFGDNGGPSGENVLWNVTHRPENGEIGEKGILTLRLPKNEYYKLTLKTLDPKVWKLGKVTVDESTEPGYVLTKAEYEIKGYGICRLSITAADEIKNKAVLEVRNIVNNNMEVSNQSLKINKNHWEKAAGFTLYPAPGTKTKKEAVALEGNFSNDFEIRVLSEEENHIFDPCLVQVVLKNNNLKKGSYQLTLKVPVYADGNEGEELLLTSKISLTVTLTEELPKVTIKQEKKVNTFYQGELGYGSLRIEAADQITSVQLKDQGNNITDYTILEKEGSYLLYPRDYSKTAGKKAEIRVFFEGYSEPVRKKLTIATEHKAPALEFERSKVNFYPAIGATETYLTIRDKKTKESISLNEYTVMNGKAVLAQLPASGMGMDQNISLKNSYSLRAGEDGVSVTLLLGQKASDKLELLVKQQGWAEAVKVSTKLNTITTEPKLVADHKKLTLNTHKDIFRNQVASTVIRLDGSNLPTDNMEVFFTGQDAKAREILNNSIRLEYWYHSGEIVARFNELQASNLPKDGTYKFKATVKLHEYNKQLSTDFTLTLKAKAPEKCITVSKKGSIDLLDRSRAIVITPKVSGMSGRPVHGELTGRDKDMFCTEWDGTSLLVFPNEWVQFSNKVTYQVTPTFEVADDKIGGYRVAAKTEKIKVKQGKASVSVQSEGNVLFDDRNSRLELDFTALLNNKTPLEIRDITLVNYTEDLWIEYAKNDNDAIEGSVALYRGGVNQIVQKGKKWNLKFEITLKDQAGNSKNILVTYPVIVK